MQEKYYLSTPIYYVNAKPHLGHMYTTLLANVMADYQQLKGKDVFFLTGLDEHGDKIVKAAAQQSLTPQQYVDSMAEIYQGAWQKLKIHNRDFIRTTEERHKKTVHSVLSQLHEQGDIYLGEYEGKYCYGCERYLTEKELNENGECPDHLTKPETIKEKNYFFKLQKYLPEWEKILENNPDLIKPEQYYKEVLGAIKEMKKQGEDLSVTRPTSRLSWGIEIPFDSDFVTYVWFDALLNYISALGYPGEKTYLDFQDSLHHVIAKDILKPHAVFWPTMMLAAKIPLFKNLYVHGYWLGFNDLKMSKSLKNAFNPLEVVDEIGLDPLRYFLMREMPFGKDTRFTEETMENRINQDLSNNLGNLIQRTLSMLKKYTAGKIPPKSTTGSKIDESRQTLLEMMNQTLPLFHSYMENFQFHLALEKIFLIIDWLNKLIEEKKPWEMAKNNDSELPALLRLLLDGIGVCMAYLKPFLPEKHEDFCKITQIKYSKAFPVSLDELDYPQPLPEKWDILFPKIFQDQN